MNKWGIAQILAGCNNKYKPPINDGLQVPVALLAATTVHQVSWTAEPGVQIHPTIHNKCWCSRTREDPPGKVLWNLTQYYVFGPGEGKKKRWRVPMLAKQDPQWNINWRPEQQRRWSGWGRYSYERMQEKIWSELAQISLALGVAVKWRAKSLIVSLWAQTLSVAEPSSILLPFWFKNETSRQVLLSTGKALEVASEKY